MNVQKSNIEYLLSRLFDADIVTRGKDLQKNAAVLFVNIDPKQGIVTAKVQGGEIYNVKLNYNVGSNSITGLKCNCPYNGYCKHIVATMVEMTKGDTKPPQTIQSYKLPAQKSDEFREIEFENFTDFAKKVQMLAPRGYQSKYEMQMLDYDVELRSDNSILVRGTTIPYFKKQEVEKLRIEVIKTENNLAVKCNNCDKKSEQLCEHSYFGLTHLASLPHLEQYINGTVDYNVVIQECSITENLTLEKAAEIFSFNLIKKSIVAKVKVKGYLHSGLIENFSKNFVEQIKDQFLSIDHLDTNTDSDEAPLINALLWNYSEDGFLFPEIISGKATVNNDRIKSGIKKEKSAKYIRQELKDAFLELAERKYTAIESEDYLPALVRQIGVIHKNMPAILNTPQYFIFDEGYDCNDHFYELKKSELRQLYFQKNQLEIKFKIELDHNICILKTHIEVDQKKYVIEELGIIHPLFVILNKQNITAFTKNHFDAITLKALESSSKIQFSLSKVNELFPMLQFLSKNYGLVIPPEIQMTVEEVSHGVKELYLQSAGQDIIFTPVLNYQDGLQYNAMTTLPLDDADEYKQINAEECKSYLFWLSQRHPLFAQMSNYSSILKLTKEEFLADYWFSSFFEECKEAEVSVLGYDQLELSKYNKNKPSITTHIESGIDWFDTKVNIKYGDLEVPMKSWVNMIKNKERFIKLTDGTLGIVPQEWIDKLTRIVEISDSSQSELRISKYHFNILDELVDDVNTYEWYQEISEKKAKLANYESNQDYILPAILTADLRAYQEKGYQWLRFLNEFGFGGCLADDMGLGKTVQVISLLAYLKEEQSCFALVVVPNSLLFNWANELTKFCPSMRFIIHHGTARNFDTISKDDCDIVITTYGTAVSDVMKLKETTFDYIILDESQAIKNPASKRNKALRLLQGKNKLVMTGTPIENNTLDLFGQFNFLNPGMLGTQSEFINNFSRAIDVSGDKEQAIKLKQIIHPFILRRTKEQVAPDLPPKTEMLLYCEMEKDQRKHYDSLLNSIKKDVTVHIEEQGVGKSKMKILEALLRLRQVCNATQLVDNASTSSSTKITTLIEHIQSNNQHKCLVFSQFVGMLSLIRKELDKQGIKYAYLDGQTRDREASVKMFQEDEDCKIFLISLKAGNTGLNLTEADYVYIVDPWWNPAVEAQAIDRTHRIGQDKHIFAYRMICKNTIEEKIIKLQEKKKTLSQDLVQTDDNVFKTLDKEELLSIFD